MCLSSRISYCTADKMHDKVFAYIVQSQHNETLECHAFLCTKRKMVSKTVCADKGTHVGLLSNVTCQGWISWTLSASLTWHKVFESTWIWILDEMFTAFSMKLCFLAFLLAGTVEVWQETGRENMGTDTQYMIISVRSGRAGLLHKGQTCSLSTRPSRAAHSTAHTFLL